MRSLLFTLSVAVVLVAAAVVPLPYEQTVTGSIRPVEDMVTVAVDGDPIDGDLGMLTVRRRDVTPLDALRAAFEPGPQVSRVSDRLPEGIDRDVYREILAQQFANSFTTAVAIAAEGAGYEVELTTEVVVTQVLPTGPAVGSLRTGDRIRSVDGVDVASAADVIDLLAGRGAGDVVTLAVDREDGPTTVEIELAVLVETGRPGIGVLPSTLTAPAELPFDVQLEDANIIGPSAGMMIAITVSDLLLDEDLTAGRRIAGTGTIDGTGAIGAIGSIELKVETAIEEQADLLLVPTEQVAVALEAAGGRIEVVGVATLDEALDALRTSATTVG